MPGTWKSKVAGLGLVVSAPLLLALPAAAALSPLYESAREIAAILADPHLGDAFANQEAIVSITATAPDIYEVKSLSCTVVVTVADAPAEPGKPMLIGPRQFTLQFGQARCQ